MCKIYGYVRVSTIQQKVERQINNIIGFNGDAIIISEKQSGKDIDNRAEFKKLLNKAKPGDTIIFDEVSRISRNADEGFSLYMELISRGVPCVSERATYKCSKIDKNVFCNTFVAFK